MSVRLSIAGPARSKQIGLSVINFEMRWNCYTSFSRFSYSHKSASLSGCRCLANALLANRVRARWPSFTNDICMSTPFIATDDLPVSLAIIWRWGNTWDAWIQLVLCVCRKNWRWHQYATFDTDIWNKEMRNQQTDSNACRTLFRLCSWAKTHFGQCSLDANRYSKLTILYQITNGETISIGAL